MAVDAIYNRAAVTIDKETLYHLVDWLCLHHHQEELYQRLSEKCKRLVESRVNEIETWCNANTNVGMQIMLCILADVHN